jgi:hypothetical protein
MVQQPTVQPVPEPVAEKSAPDPQQAVAAPTSRSRVAAPAAEREAPAPQPATPAKPAQAAAPPPVADTTAATPVAPVAVEPSTVDRPREGTSDLGVLAVIFAGLAIVALAIWGFIAIGRRKPVRRYVAERTAPSTAASAAPTAIAAQPARAVEPVVATDPARPVQQLFTTREAGGLPHTGASVALPRALPDDYETREALFRRMVDARPDRANPFTDRRARMKRARLIMQSIGRDFGDADPWIDLSQYPNNWPELHKRSAAA